MLEVTEQSLYLAKKNNRPKWRSILVNSEQD